MFCGLDAQFARDVPFYMFFFGSYDLLVYTGKNLAPPSVNEEVVFFMSGGLAGMFSWAVAMPFDVPKTITQTNWNSRVWGDYAPTFKKIFRERGVRGLYVASEP